jgi:hypothetical protein
LITLAPCGICLTATASEVHKMHNDGFIIMYNHTYVNLFAYLFLFIGLDFTFQCFYDFPMKIFSCWLLSIFIPLSLNILWLPFFNFIFGFWKLKFQIFSNSLENVELCFLPKYWWSSTICSLWCLQNLSVPNSNKTCCVLVTQMKKLQIEMTEYAQIPTRSK